MTNTPYKRKKAMPILIVFLLLLSVLAGCGSSSDSLLPGGKIPEGVWLPFDESGKWIWSAAEFSDARVEHLNERTEGYAVSSNLTARENAQAFIDLMNGTQKELLGAVKQPLSSDDPIFAEFDRGTELYWIRMSISEPEQYHMATVSKTADCGYLWFRLYEYSKRDDYFYSLYRIDLNSVRALEQFFEGLEKEQDVLFAKPVLYLYPEDELDVSVKLAYKGRLAVTYPAYHDGWQVRAYPDGSLINRADGLTYSYLFWEGIPDHPARWDLSEGYCVAGADTAVFLQKTLSELGLTPREYNEFIVYWLPQMQNNPYNLIAFQWENYDKLAPLEIHPFPDSVLRVFMVFAPLEKPVEINTPAAQPSFERNGFTVVEWGGSKIAYSR
ncbi:MAG: hypothetical protein FWE80_00970 [Oscillospiraceae bacterium]|nr:hypothetical protein [Oscillospiraceae bacterium]